MKFSIPKLSRLVVAYIALVGLYIVSPQNYSSLRQIISTLLLVFLGGILVSGLVNLRKS